MRRFSVRIIIASIAFLVGILAATVWLSAGRKPRPAFALSKPCPTSPGKEPIDAAAAAHRAECFLIGNGYTDLPPMEDRSKLSYESWADGLPAEEALARRRDTVESRAYGVMGGLRSKDGWAVAFRLNLHHPFFGRVRPETLEHSKTVGRVVTMDAYGGSLRVEHEEFPLSNFRRIEEFTP
jgi:hypothetical protein